MPRVVDYLIVGQGLAGSLLGCFLEEEGKEILFVDDGHQTAATNVAAGIVNPITGRRYVKSWMIDELIPFAQDFYKKIELDFNIKLWYNHNIIRALHSQKEENEWLIRSSIPTYLKYIEESESLGCFNGKVVEPYSFMEIKNSGRVDVSLLIKSFKDKWQINNQIKLESFDYNNLEIQKDYISYKEIKAKGIIFCEGYKSRFNPYFSDLGFEGAKGEVLLVKIPNVNFDKILKHKLFVVPFGSDTYWVGSTNKRYAEEDLPTEDNRFYLIDKLKSFLDTDFEVLDHKAAVRPTIKDRRPILGTSPKYKNLSIFGGLGTKGATLGPYWAKVMVDYLLRDVELPKEVNIRRWYAK